MKKLIDVIKPAKTSQNTKSTRNYCEKEKLTPNKTMIINVTGVFCPEAGFLACHSVMG